MTMNQSQGNHFTLFWRYVVGSVVVWTVIIAGSLVSNIHLLNKQSMELVRKEAIANFNKDQGFRLWGTKHGGVYVPVTEDTPASPYLSHIPERDIETPSGRKLTLMNPAYMVRQLMVDYKAYYGVRGKITGLVVLRPGNAPDEWEKAALIRLKEGLGEVSEISNLDGDSYYRLMRPMYMKPGCEKCHGHLGFKLGDFRGGVGVSVPLAPYLEAKYEALTVFATTHAVVWILGLAGIGFGVRQVRGRISERDRAEAEVRLLNETLEVKVEERTAELKSAQDGLLRAERLATLGQLTGTVAHEIRNPLGAVSATAKTIELEIQHAGLGLDKMFARMNRGLQRCENIITELLDFARAKGLEVEPTPLDSWVTLTLNEITIPKGITLHRALEAEGVVPDFDRDRLRRALINVVDNACQAMADDGGKLTVATGAGDSRVEITITDTGPGIPEDILPKIFEPLFSTKQFGVGLGLPTVRQIMEEHGGGFEITNGANAGARATLWLPLAVSVTE